MAHAATDALEARKYFEAWAKGKLAAQMLPLKSWLHAHR
jgi:hypothetical protein